MKTRFLLLAALALATFSGSRELQSRGLPDAMHDNIHALFDGHAKITRKVEMTEKGYVAITESKNPKLAKILREHVSQMRERLQSGMMVRRWDPAFPELVEHYDDITHRVEATKRGLKITVTGKTPDAIKVAKNHAKIVSDFAKNGWKAHDTLHPRAIPTPAAATASADSKPGGVCDKCRKQVTASKPDCTACKKAPAKSDSKRPCCLSEGNKKACAACTKTPKK